MSETILERATRSNFGRDPYSIEPDSRGHRTRFSDSSFYDEVCVCCGATDGSGDDGLRGSCPSPLPPREEVVAAALSGSAGDEAFLGTLAELENRSARRMGLMPGPGDDDHSHDALVAALVEGRGAGKPCASYPSCQHDSPGPYGHEHPTCACGFIDARRHP